MTFKDLLIINGTWRMMTMTRFALSPNCFVITVDWMNCLYCQTEDGPRADGPRGCGHEGTPQEHRAGCCHAGRCLHRWDEVRRSRLIETEVKWISNWIFALFCPSCYWQMFLSVVKASFGHRGWAQRLAGRVGAEWGTWLAGVYLQQEDGCGEASSWGEAQI